MLFRTQKLDIEIEAQKYYTGSSISYKTIDKSIVFFVSKSLFLIQKNTQKKITIIVLKK